MLPRGTNALAIAPTRSSRTTGLVAALRYRLTRTCHWVSGVAACQVSTPTRARSSVWLPSERRWRLGLSRVHSAIESQLETVPSAAWPRTCTLTTESPSVTASHVGISWVSPKPGADHGDVHVPTW